MSLWERGRLEALATRERSVLERMPSDRLFDELFVQPGGGAGAGAALARLRVTERKASWVLGCKELDAMGEPMGNQFDVNTITFNVEGLAWSDEEHDPPVIVGSDILAARCRPDDAWYCLWRIRGTSPCP